MSQNKKAKLKLTPLGKRILRLTTKIAAFIIAVMLLLQYVFGFFYIRGNYMFPAIKDGDFVITYKLDDIVKNDVVLYKTNGNKRLGRIVATQGDTVNVSENGELLINGCVATEEIFYGTTLTDTLQYPYTVPKGTVFILNDYRSGTDDSTKDSRTYGAVKTSDLDGKVWLLFRRRGF